MGKIVVQTFSFNIDSNWLAGTFSINRITMHITTVYYIILQHITTISSISVHIVQINRSMKKSPGSQAEKSSIPTTDKFPPLRCCNVLQEEFAFLALSSKESPKQPQFRTSHSFAASRLGFYRPQDHLSINFAMSGVVNKIWGISSQILPRSIL